MSALLLVCSLMAADITIHVADPLTNEVTVTVVVKPGGKVEVVQPKLVATNASVMRSASAASIAKASRTPPEPPPMPPEPVSRPKFRLLPHLRPKPLPGATNRTYAEHLEAMAERAAKGKRRGE